MLLLRSAFHADRWPQEVREFDGSYANAEEVSFCTWLIAELLERGVAGDKIGVITLYKAQARRIAAATQHLRFGTAKANVQVSTVDAFQGGEKEIAILSCVRTTSSDFMDATKRMNVALTRARRHLLIIGAPAAQAP